MYAAATAGFALLEIGSFYKAIGFSRLPPQPSHSAGRLALNRDPGLINHFCRSAIGAFRSSYRKVLFNLRIDFLSTHSNSDVKFLKVTRGKMFFKRIFAGVNFVKEKDLAKLEVLAYIKGRTLQQQVYHDRQTFMDMVRTIHADFNNDPKIKHVNRKTGTATIVKAVNAMGALPTFNFRR